MNPEPDPMDVAILDCRGLFHSEEWLRLKKVLLLIREQRVTNLMCNKVYEEMREQQASIRILDNLLVLDETCKILFENKSRTHRPDTEEQIL